MAGKFAKAKRKVRDKMKKVSGKIKKMKEKINGLRQKSACLIGIVLPLTFLGCTSADPASRATSTDYGGICIRIGEYATAEVSLTFGDGAIASADSSGSTESTTATPTTTTSTDLRASIPIKGNGTGDILSRILGSFINTGNSTANSNGNCAGNSQNNCQDCNDI